MKIIRRVEGRVGQHIELHVIVVKEITVNREIFMYENFRNKHFR